MLPSAPMTFTDVCGRTVPTELNRCSGGHSNVVAKVTGLVSVIPYAITIERRPISCSSLPITAGGTNEPAAMPFLREVKSRCCFLLASSSERNIVGTPYSAVQRSVSMASRTRSGSNRAAGKTIELPCVKAPRNPITRPKQWKSGGGQQTISLGLKRTRSPTNQPLLIKFLYLALG